MGRHQSTEYGTQQRPYPIDPDVLPAIVAVDHTEHAHSRVESTARYSTAGDGPGSHCEADREPERGVTYNDELNSRLDPCNINGGGTCVGVGARGNVEHYERQGHGAQDLHSQCRRVGGIGALIITGKTERRPR